MVPVHIRSRPPLTLRPNKLLGRKKNMKSYLINGRNFKSKTAAGDYIRSIVDRYRDNQSIIGEDFEFLSELVLMHEESQQKIGCGISEIFITHEAEYGGQNRHFNIRRIDGTTTDFSWKKCLEANNPSKDIYNALRQAIKDQIIKFKELSSYIGTQCPLSGEILTTSNCHVDHIKPDSFLNLVNEFLAHKKININYIKISDPSDNQLVAELVDEQFKIEWQNFHRSKCKLRVISKTANLSHAK